MSKLMETLEIFGTIKKYDGGYEDLMGIFNNNFSTEQLKNFGELFNCNKKLLSFEKLSFNKNLICLSFNINDEIFCILKRVKFRISVGYVRIELLGNHNKKLKKHSWYISQPVIDKIVIDIISLFVKDKV